MSLPLFLAIIDKNFRYPHEIHAPSKQVAYVQLLKNVPKDSITGIFTEEEYQKKMAGATNNGNMTGNGEIVEAPIDFNSIVAEATAKAIERDGIAVSPIEINQNNAALPNNQENSKPIEIHKEIKEDEISYYTDNGIEFMIKNKKLYKKVWRDITSTESNQYRIVSISGKSLKSEKYKIQILDWQELS